MTNPLQTLKTRIPASAQEADLPDPFEEVKGG
jgi:hypothetical protein